LPTGNPGVQGLLGAAAPGLSRNAGGATTVGGAPSPRTFQEFYADAARDPLHGVYERIMSRFDPEQVVAVEAATLFEQAVTSNSGVPQAYLCCASTRRGPRIYCVHLPSRFPSALDGRITPWDNQVYAFLGETTNGTATTVVFPNNAFHPTPATFVRMQETIVNELPDVNQNITIFQPYINNNANAALGSEVTTRYLMYFPARYAQHFLDSSGYTATEMWNVLPVLLAEHQDLVHCQPLLKWLRVASHGTSITNGQGQQVVGPPVNALQLISPTADRELLSNRQYHLHLALPGLAQPAASLESALLHMASAVVAQTNDNRLARESRANESSLPKLPSAKFHNTLPILLDYLQIMDEVNLPPLWHQWANANKRQELTLFQDLLDTYARGNEAFYYVAPVVSPKIVQDLLSFTFMGTSPEDLKTGIHPFVIADGSEEHRRSNLELARTYGMLTSGEQSIMYADLQALEAKEVRSVPVNYFELEKTLGMFGNFLGVTLGSGHPLTTSYRLFWDVLAKGLRNEIQFILDHTTARIKPAHVLRSIQLMCYSWFNHRKVRLQPPVIDFAGILHQITLQTYIIPHLPPPLYRLANPLASKQASIISNITPSTASQASYSHQASDTVSVLTSPTVPTAYASTHSSAPTPSVIGTPSTATFRSTNRGSFQSNLTPDNTLQSLVPANIKLRDLIGTSPPPLMDDGTPICLSYHMRQGCWSSCRRMGSHGKQLSSSEKQRLATFALHQMAQRQQAPTPP